MIPPPPSDRKRDGIKSAMSYVYLLYSTTTGQCYIGWTDSRERTF